MNWTNVEIAGLVALQRTGLIPGKIESLIEIITEQPEDFKVGWTFNGTKHFISQHAPLAPYRAWLQQLIAALEGGSSSAATSEKSRVCG